MLKENNQFLINPNPPFWDNAKQLTKLRKETINFPLRSTPDPPQVAELENYPSATKNILALDG